MFEGWTKVSIKLEQRSRDAVPDRARLARRTTTRYVDDEVEFVCGFSQLQRLTNDHPQRFVREVAIERFVVDFDFAAAGSQVNSAVADLRRPVP